MTFLRFLGSACLYLAGIALARLAREWREIVDSWTKPHPEGKGANRRGWGG